VAFWTDRRPRSRLLFTIYMVFGGPLSDQPAAPAAQEIIALTPFLLHDRFPVDIRAGEALGRRGAARFGMQALWDARLIGTPADWPTA